MTIHAAHTSSAFDNVPTETIVEIFHFCLSAYPLEYRQPDTTIAPMLLCQVSSLWRSIAMDTPSLWIYLNHAGYVTTEDLVTAQVLQRAIWPIETAFLRWWTANLQSAQAVVYLELYVKEESRYRSNLDSGVNDQAVFEGLICNAQGLYLEQSILISFWRCFDPVHLNSPNLRSVFIDQKGISANLTGSSQNDLDAIPIRFSTNLKRFIKHGYIFHVPLHRQLHDRIPWATLTHISIRTLLVTATEWCKVIRCFLSLQVGEFHIKCPLDAPLEPSFDFSASRSHVSLSHVETLNLCITEYPLKFNPLQNLSFPNIVRLAIYVSTTNLDTVRAIVQSCPRLRDLRLAPEWICTEPRLNTSTGRIWDSVPELCSLTVDISEVIDELNLEPEGDLKTLMDWIQVLSSSWLYLEDPPVSFQRLVFTALKGEDKIMRIKSGIRSHCALLGLPPHVEVDVRRTIDADWNFSVKELRSWM